MNVPEARIGIDARPLCAQASGIGRYVEHLLRGLHELNQHRRVVLLTHAHTRIPDDLAGVYASVRTPDPMRHPRNQVRLPRVLKRAGVGVFLCPDAMGPIWGDFRKVIVLHDVIPLACRHLMPTTRKSKHPHLWRNWLRLQCAAADAVVTVSEYSRGDLVRHLGLRPEHVHVVPPSVGLQPGAAVPAPDDRRHVLYVGRSEPYKNLAGLVRSFDQVRQRLGDTVRLVIAGEPDARFTEPVDLVRRRGLESSVHFTGRLSEDELASAYRAASVFAFPSLYEGFGLPPLEAMSLGTPVVSSNRASLPEVLGDAAILVDPADETRFAQAIVRVLEDRELAARLVERGYLQAARYLPREQAAAMLRVLAEVADEAARHG